MPQEHAIYPFPDTVKEQAQDMTKGNFGLWYNKFIPVKTYEDKKDAFKTCDASGKVPEVVEFYEARYKLMQKETAAMLKRLLGKKHQDQSDYCGSFSESDYKVITIRALLKTPLITGIGESHPHEVSMVFDHNLGIPYIPASGVKGIVRFAHTLSIFLDETGKVKEEYQNQDSIEESVTDIPDIFGGIKAKGKEKDVFRGSAVFLDAYPENLPDLHVDIMNPHYGDYYGDPKKETPPADYLSPNPLKFLTVAPGTTFIFRAIAEKKTDLPDKVRTAFTKALTEEGVGAKTAAGYGRFEIIHSGQSAADGNNNVPMTKTAAPPPPAEEVWENAFVGFNAGSGGVLTAQLPDKKKAEIRGKDKAMSATDAGLHKKLFDGKKTLPKARVTVRKAGNAWEIVRIEPPK